LARFFLPPTSQARAVDQVVAAVPTIKAIECLATCFRPKNPSSTKANEELIVVVACQESTQTQGFTLNAKKTKTNIRTWSSISRAFVVTRRVETKKGCACHKSPP